VGRTYEQTQKETHVFCPMVDGWNVSPPFNNTMCVQMARTSDCKVEPPGSQEMAAIRVLDSIV
jgi:hypothetical protein